MRFPISVLAIVIIVGYARADDSDKPWQIHGQVVDEHGKPVKVFEAATGRLMATGGTKLVSCSKMPRPGSFGRAGVGDKRRSVGDQRSPQGRRNHCC
jgi:hypothetical protein